MENNSVKITKKHLRLYNGETYGGEPYCIFDHDIYILQYKYISFFGKEKWKEFPVYFLSEDTIQDFAKTAYIFNFQFNVFVKGIGDISYVSSGDNCWIELTDLKKYDKYKIFTYSSQFLVSNGKVFGFSPKFKDKLLSAAYQKYINAPQPGLSEVLEEKEYKIVAS